GRGLRAMVSLSDLKRIFLYPVPAGCLGDGFSLASSEQIRYFSRFSAGAERCYEGSMAVSGSGRLNSILRSPKGLLVLLALACGLAPWCAHAQDVSAPAIFQDFENTYKTIENRTADIFMAGYGSVYTPPPGRADLSNFSVGYDVYDRFDLGKAGNPTLYGTETGLKALVNSVHRM